MSPILGIWASSSAASRADTGAMFPLGSIYVSTAVSNVTFTNIPSTYTHLQIRATGRTDRSTVSDFIQVQFNSDTATNYTIHGLEGDGATPSTYGNASSNNINVYRFAAANATSNVFGTTVIDILDYANTNKFKTVRSLGGADNNGSGVVGLTTGAWRNTNAITSIKLLPGLGTNFVQYSQFTLYGIKAA